MLYIHTALKPEAQAFVDKYKLKKMRVENFTFFTGTTLTLVVSGIGVTQTQRALHALQQNFQITQKDIIINVGICGADTNYKIGELVEIDSISYKENTYSLEKSLKKTLLTCLDTPQEAQRYELVDMESYGFYSATKQLNANLYIFKVVSDHFEPEKVTKENTKELIFNVIDAINTIIYQRDSQ